MDKAGRLRDLVAKRQWFSWVGVVTAGLTTLCCLGVSAALSLATKHVGHGFTGGRLVLVWIGLAALVVAQVWDLVRVRRRPGEPAIEFAP
jgi:hypothetical protein